jgi:hypothetical protein
MEDGRNDGFISRDRLLEALLGEKDIPTGQAMWCAMGRYHWKGREQEVARPSGVTVRGSRAHAAGGVEPGGLRW